MKTCSRCAQAKELSEFYTLKSGQVLAHCKECGKARSSAWYAANTERANAASSAWVVANPEARKKIANRWAKKNHEQNLIAQRAYGRAQAKKHKETKWKYRAKMRQTNPEYNLANSLRCRLYAALQGIGKKSNTTLQLLGCSLEALRAHLETQFKTGMSWENYGSSWHVDHRKPCAKFDLSNPDEQKKCFHFSNLQPLFALENLQKGASYFHRI